MKQVIKKKIAETHNITQELPIYTLIVDGNSLLKQSLVNSRIGSDGKDYGAVMTFYATLSHIIPKYDFNFCYIFFDAPQSGQLRYDIYKDYKSNRDKEYDTVNHESEYFKQIDAYCQKVINYSRKNKKEVQRGESEDESFQRQKSLVMAIAEELFIRTYEAERYVEGDDLIGYYVNHRKENEKIVIVTRDRDLTQLISDNVSVYLSDLKKFIHPRNHIKEMGYPHENVLIKKILCGDSSDAIKGIKGMGEKTFFNLFPDALTQRITLDDIFVQSRKINEERAFMKKKPLAVVNNVLNAVTDGCQGKEIYEINRKIIDLNSPMMTKEAKKDMEELMYAPIDPEGRNYTNIYQISKDNGMIDLMNEEKFTTIFSNFFRLMENEKKYYKKSMEN